ncbi:MAG: hypothetical protein KF860_01260 [Cyclobacteriaceae bacterium]|nr:hypothetical protein [Cyclobacteriaceae bacterium]
MRFLQEKVYLHTDKPYYYPGEVVWFKAYFSYTSPALKDSLSKVLYVELINSDSEIVNTSILKIEEGVSWGDIELPNTLPPDTYALRAYTNWMRNFPVNISYKRLLIFSYAQNIDPSVAKNLYIPEIFNVQMTPNKGVYHPRERVDLSVKILDKQSQTISANISISVTDTEIAVPLPDDKHIMTGALAIDPTFNNTELQYALERGITVKGKVLDGNKPMEAPVIAMRNDGKLLTAHSSSDGFFAITDLDFYGSLQFTFQPLGKKERPIGQVELIERDVPPIEFEFLENVYPFRSMDMAQRVQNTYTLKEDVKLLKEVVVIGKAVKVDSIVDIRSKLYSEPYHTVKGEDLLPGSNPILSLQGKVPGLRVFEYYDEFNMRRVSICLRCFPGKGLSGSESSGPVILVDGIPFQNVNDFVGFPVSLIDRIEVKTGVVPLLGSRGNSGLIAIYTKRGGITPKYLEPNFNTFWVKGYNTTKAFPMPDYSTSSDHYPKNDFRSTLYWNPNVKIDSATETKLSFYTSALPGKYRIVIEGLTPQGIPIKAEQFIIVE